MEIKNKIIFDDVVLYNKDTAELINILNPENIATLTVPANECLAIIIENSPNVTTQKQLFNDVWEVHGIPINSNTFYQNISILRKAFKQVGIDYDVIVTIPRRGIELSKNIKITTYDNDNKKHSHKQQHDNKNRKPKNKKRNFYLSLLFFTIMFLVYFSYYYYIQTTSPFYNYSFIKENHGCYIYANENYSQESIDKIIETINLKQCNNQENIYLSTVPNLPRISMIICDTKIYQQKSLCRSAYYYLSGDKE